MDIIRSNEFQKQCNLYKRKKKKLKKRVDNIKGIVENNTKKEKVDLERSIKNFNNKVKSIMESDPIKKETTEIKREEKQMYLSMNKVMDIYSQARDIIMKDTSIDNKVKHTYLTSLEDKMLDKLYDKEEREHFKRMVSNMIIMVPGNSTQQGNLIMGGQMGGQMREQMGCKMRGKMGEQMAERNGWTNII